MRKVVNRQVFTTLPIYEHFRQPDQYRMMIRPDPSPSYEQMIESYEQAAVSYEQTFEQVLNMRIRFLIFRLRLFG